MQYYIANIFNVIFTVLVKLEFLHICNVMLINIKVRKRSIMALKSTVNCRWERIKFMFPILHTNLCKSVWSFNWIHGDANWKIGRKNPANQFHIFATKWRSVYHYPSPILLGLDFFNEYFNVLLQMNKSCIIVFASKGLAWIWKSPSLTCNV